ncbi:MAG: hypothetical protein ACUVV3_08885 [Dehalococcoidia bacterium]
MPTYVMRYRFTDQGHKRIKETVRRTAKVRNIAEAGKRIQRDHARTPTRRCSGSWLKPRVCGRQPDMSGC